MSPNDVWVIYNKYSTEIIFVAAEEFFAQRELNALFEESDQDEVVSKRQKLIVTTLARALAIIAAEHRAAIDEVTTENENAQKWRTY